MTDKNMNDPKIVKILDDYNVVLNQGTNFNIRKDDEYVIYRKTEEIFDPDTQDNLGCLLLPKGKGYISYVQDKMSVLKSMEYENSALYEAFSIFRNKSDLKPFQNPIIGDFARKITNETETESCSPDESFCLRCGAELDDDEKENGSGLCSYCNNQMEKIKEEDE